MAENKVEQAVTEIIALSELTDIEEETARYYRRKEEREPGSVLNCADFVVAYAPTLIQALRAAIEAGANTS